MTEQPMKEETVELTVEKGKPVDIEKQNKDITGGVRLRSYAGIDIRAIADGRTMGTAQTLSVAVKGKNVDMNITHILFDEDLVDKYKTIKEFHCHAKNEYGQEAILFKFKNLKRTFYGSGISVDDVQLGCQMHFKGKLA